MRRLARYRPSPAMVVSMVALFVALGGVSYAALAINSVGSKQLKKNAVTAAKIKKDAVTGAKVKDGSLSNGDFAAGQIPAGPIGKTGPAGPAGAAGTAVAFARIGADGKIEAAAPSQTKIVKQVNIEHVAASGIYCFGGLPFTVNSVQVTTDNADALTTSNQIPATAVFRGETLGSCGAGFQQVRVVMTEVNNTAAPKLVDHGFYIWFE